jgi:hypothetical protein
MRRAPAAGATRERVYGKLLRPRRRLKFILVALALAVCAATLGLSLGGSTQCQRVARVVAGPTIYVNSRSSEQCLGTQGQPFGTVQQAVTVARGGDTVLVASGRYPETVWLDGRSSGVTFRGVGASRPVIDGGGSRKYGVSTTRELEGATIDNFEIAGQTDEGVRLLGRSNLLTNSVIHHVGGGGNRDARGVVGWGERLRVVHNTIASIGPGGEAMGIMLANSRDSQVDANTIYLIRKEGVRDFMGLDNEITNNRIFLTWTAIAPNQSAGGYIANNYLYKNTQGFNPKHTGDPPTLKYWNIDTPHWTRFWHNTVYASSASSAAIAINAPVADYIDIRDNIFADAGGTYLADAVGARGNHMIVDGNAYARTPAAPRWLYHTGYNFGADGYQDLAEIRSGLGWEQHGTTIDPRLRDPANGDLDYNSASPAAAGSLDLPDPLGRQLGARGLPPAPVTWTEYAMKPIASSSAQTWYTANHLNDTSDGAHQTYWLTSTANNEFVTYDFGQARTIDHLVLDVYSDGDKRMVRNYRFEASNDNVHYHTILQGTNPDSRGSSYKYELPTTTTRYLRFTLIDSFCDQYNPPTGCGQDFVLSDLRAGAISVRRP